MKSTAAVLLLAGLLGLPALATAGDQPAAFRSAVPIWPQGREKEMNLSVGFAAAIEKPEEGRTVLRLSAATIYRVWVNGRFVGCGPARGPHGFYRVDQWDITDKLSGRQNVVAIEVAGYNANSYYLLDQPSFLQAEVLHGDRVLASTGGKGTQFTAGIVADRVQRVERYSFQRPFIEVYHLAPGFDRWHSEVTAALPAVATARQPVKKLLERGVPYPTYTLRRPTRLGPGGRMEKLDHVGRLWKDRSLTNIGPTLKGYPESELAVIPSNEAQAYKTVCTDTSWKPADPASAIALGAETYRIVDFGTDLTGFLGATVDCKRKTRLWFIFDEILDGPADVNFRRLGCCDVIEYDLQPGRYEVESIEPYTLRYLKLVCLEGDCTVTSPHLREYAHPEITAATFHASDERLNELYAAGVQTFRQNALDIFMDCPSRERAGWLCDSFFTSRVEHDLVGRPQVERNFLQNFLLPAFFAHLPDGMLPMCYPADHYNGNFIPNWSLWFVVQLEEYSARSGDRATVDSLRPKVMKLFDYFHKYQNSDGLLEKLPGWVFVEWSAANRFVQDVNYPTNMLYAGALDAAGRIYHEPKLRAEAAELREVIRRQSFDGEFFVDNALRRDGKLQVTRNRSEVCQYFAFFFDVATPETYPELWATLRDKFGPDRKDTKAFPEVDMANSFIGNMLRVELLSRAGRSQQILDESIAYLLYMARRTGTLWENVSPSASCDHGFASHIVHTLYRDVLGLYRVDTVNHRVLVRFGDVDLARCEGRIPTPQGPVALRWRKDGNRILYHLDVPPGYEVKIDNPGGRQLVPQP